MAILNVRKAMELRQSMRTYRKEALAGELRHKLENSFKDNQGPFGLPVRFALVDTDKKEEDVKLGTYGVIKGATTFLCAAVEKKPRYEENLGYALEEIILYATSLGLGTCWLGGTFKRGEFAKALNLKASEELPAITPVGFSADKRSLLESLMVKYVGARNRKSFQELFFDKSFETPLDPEAAGTFKEALEMVRIGPSASNKQPWRVVKDGERYHFYVCRTKGYGKMMEFDIQRLDIGIAMCHFELAAKEAGLSGSWSDENPGLALPELTEYIITYVPH